jgi:hypothetical protein
MVAITRSAAACFPDRPVRTTDLILMPCFTRRSNLHLGRRQGLVNHVL